MINADFLIEEVPGESLPDLATVQALARSAIVVELALAIRRLLDAGRLVEAGTRIVPATRIDRDV